MIKRIDHVSLAVNDYEKARVFFTELLGLVPGACGSDERNGFFWQLFSCGDLSRFELIAPSKENSFLDSFLNNKTGGVHHVTFQVENINEAACRLEYMKVPYFGFNDKYENWKELFIHPRHAFGLLIQFAQFKPADWLDRSQNLDSGARWEIKVSENLLHLELEHPGGGTVTSKFDPEELDVLIAELVNARQKMK
jgi:methylmalonyl-CoA/ethylmalonyl-CoA epimerase